jgi:hypothetical protein
MLKKRAQTFNPKLENHKELHLTHMLAHPESMQLPPKQMHANHFAKQSSCNYSSLIGQTGQHHQSDWCPKYEQCQHSDRSDRCTTEPINGSKPPGHLLYAFSRKDMLKLLPLVDNAWIKPKMQKMQPRASHIDKIQHRMLHM